MNTINKAKFTNLYPVSKTLRFELQPIGKTKENIEKNGIYMKLLMVIHCGTFRNFIREKVENM